LIAALFPFLIIFSWLVLVFIIAFICKQRFPKTKELTRKIIHIFTGPIIPIAYWLDVSKELGVLIGSMISIGLIINQKVKLIPAIEDINRKSYGTTLYPISITLLFLFFWPENAYAVIAGVLVMAFGDGFAGLIGKHIPSMNWKIFGQRKSIAGTLTMSVISGSVLLVMLLITGEPINAPQILMITFLAVIVEQISSLGIDNISVPFCVALGWLWLVNI
tara:strand:+ start:98171 stop:98827 length:657 start_codon:yes stop_codon:yes gene_type:complete